MSKIKSSFFIKTTIYLLVLRSPLIIASILCYLLTHKKIFAKFTLSIIPFLIFLVVAALYSMQMNNDMGNISGQGRDILLAIIVALFLIECGRYDIGNRKIIYNSLKICLSLIACGKIFIIVFSVITGISAIDIITWITQVWDINMMKMGVGDTFITRLQIPMDSLVPFMLYFITKDLILGRGGFKTKIIFTLLAISLALTLSRSFWAQGVLFIGLAVLLEARISKILKILALSTLVIAIIMFLTPLGDVIFAIIESRLNNQNANAASDLERDYQNNALLNAISTHPLLGHGMGYYIPNVLRSTTTPYLYESQTLSIIMDFGIIGVSVLLLIFLSTCISNALNVSSKKRVKNLIMPLICFSIWLLSGSVNPFLFGASGGIIIFFFSRFHYVDDFYQEK
ncbi:O-antigen ligase family protein [Serratia quinivorans]|uniref:O-antigen ligase family protein n=1 Tax=Serratia quinivorans TaxID=137545 RepID=UPI0021786CD9|nr:O-antigen ligase family protein [Serratia quinivorans]CAI0905133.1 Lipid A core - O-antigen ligase and related enzymes [Serratia quinivorans]CAI0931780.1 Lipid A core - O-antigen ligase and related enzymes [Serratia quinivorans]CAI1524002.1 Lipid A core - O-antigen ligase and related enzymes [Serratia quinivorans]CAI2060512.1 Lipid A core - O-antigen ligase and related enzymes [Serratia quinivorans]CAI2094439.1 Lipid A core - O-antigen ligase and related enzymes [Serratia quinivorans]